MRRKQGCLVPLESSILDVVNNFYHHNYFYGFQIAKQIQGKSDYIGHGTIYRALMRLEKMGYLSSIWEASIPTNEHRPRRRLYKLTDKKRGEK